MKDLPDDIWLAILAHIPRRKRYKLIGLSRFLFENHLDQVYKEVNLNIISLSERTAAILNPTIARWIKRLSIEICHIDALEHFFQSASSTVGSAEPKPRTSSEDTGPHPLLQSQCGISIRSSFVFNANLSSDETVAIFPNLRDGFDELRIQCECDDFKDLRPSPTIDSMFSLMKPRSLVLHIPPSTAPVVLRIFQTTATNDHREVKELSVSFPRWRISGKDATPHNSDLIVNMIQSFPQLTKLTVMDQLGYPRIDSLLSQIQHIPHLTTAVVQTRPPLDWSTLGLAIATFLQENTAIRDLEVDICTGGPAIFSAKGNDGWEFLDALAPVKSLTINPFINTTPSVNTSALSHCLTSYQLTKLVVLEMNFGEVELRQVFGDAELVYLRELELRLKTIDRQSIETLSKRAVRLERLTLRGWFNDMSHHKPSLIVELSATPLEWNLKDISIVTDAHFAMTFRTFSFYIMMALAISVPSISQFEGSPERYNAMRWGNDYIALRKGFEQLCPRNPLYSAQLG
ncbi:hypothetical protein ONZ45_g1182 [Pleurotus djamor]|nr:hypothetical protein ONZ45_g1182 [Pleurotus djamor]